MHDAIGEALRNGLHPFGLMLAHVSKTECGSMALSVGDNAFGECATVEGFPPPRRDHLNSCSMRPPPEQFPRTRCATAAHKTVGDPPPLLPFLPPPSPPAHTPP